MKSGAMQAPVVFVQAYGEFVQAYGEFVQASAPVGLPEHGATWATEPGALESAVYLRGDGGSAGESE